MAATDSHLLSLTDAQRQLLETWLLDFDRAWDTKRLSVWLRKLPPAGDPLRLPALVEIVKIDLERNWRQKRPARLENYLKVCPELGTRETVCAELVHAEYEARQLAGTSADLADFSRRFPRQAEELRRLIAPQAPANPVDPSHATPVPPGARSSGESADANEIRPTLETASPKPSTHDHPEPKKAPAALPERFGRYRIVKVLGRGGMGSVYLAHDTQLDRPVALKVPHFTAEDGPGVLERFHREARSAATIQHANICPVYDVGQVGDVHYLTMAYVEGQPLSEFIKADKRLTQRTAAVVVRKAALALEEAHKMGVIHRDLKPSNIMINTRKEPVIMDFGLARRFNKGDVRLTQDGSVLGTPAYMPPEQVRGEVEVMGPAGDVYSLGVVLYELLTGRLPFQGPMLVVLAQIQTADPPPPSAHRPDLDPGLEAVCRKAMAKKVEDRYPSMAALAHDLTAYLQGGAPAKDREKSRVPDDSAEHSPARTGTPEPPNERPATLPPARPRNRTARRLVLAGVGAALLLGTAFGVWRMSRRVPEVAQPRAPGGGTTETGAGARPGVMPLSEVALREGSVHIRSLRLEMNPVAVAAPPDQKVEPPRWVVVSNQAEPAQKLEQGGRARVHFQITNNSFEGATLSRVELALLGVVNVYEDEISPPRPPVLARAGFTREVKFGTPKTLSDVTDMAATFGEVNDPPSPLRFEAVSDFPEIALPALSPAGKVQVFLPMKKGGSATVTLRARNAFDLSAETTYGFKSEPKPPRVLKQVEPISLVDVDRPKTLPDVADVRTMFDDANNDPPNPQPLRFEVTSSLPGVAVPTLDPQQRLQIAIPGKQGGKATITIKATNEYNLSEVVSFPITLVLKVKGPVAILPLLPRADREIPLPRNYIPTGNPANIPKGIQPFSMDRETLGLTNVQFAHSLKRDEFLRPCTSGNLVPGDADAYLKPNTGRRVVVDVSCPTTWELPANLPKDLLVGTRDRRLAARPPRLVESYHLLVLTAELIGEDGKRYPIYGDRVYVLQQTVTGGLVRAEEQDIDQALAALLKACVKPCGETAIYPCAAACGVLPANADPLAIEASCFYGDRKSPYRRQDLVVPADTWPRTNLARVFEQACSAHPKLAGPLDASLAKLAADAALGRRAAHVTQQMRSLPAAEAVESKPPHPAADK